MAVNKVDFGDETLIDLTNDTVAPQTLAQGVTAHDASGNEIVGTMAAGGNITVDNVPVKDSTNAISSGYMYSYDEVMKQLWTGLDDRITTLEGLVEKITELEQEITGLKERLGGLSFQKSTTEPSGSTDESVITFVK